MRFILRHFACLILACLPLLGFTQSFQDYQPYNNNPAKEKQLLDAINKRFQDDQSAVTGKNRKDIIDLYKERYELVKKKIEENELITDEEIQQYLDRLTQVIVNQNKIIPSDIRIRFSRSYWPNASSMGEGTIVFNIGLFSRLQNEAQVAFVISHELAHYYLNHSNLAIRRYVEAVNSDEIQKQLKEIRNSSYGKNAAVEKLAMTLSFGSRRHSRAYEQAADSMALEFMRSTPFDLNEALSTLALLDSVDKDKYQADLKLKETFNFAGYPFKNKWIVSNTLSFTDTKEEIEKKKSLEDSLKTHPDCKHRIEVLSLRVQQYRSSASKTFVIDEAEFNKIKRSFDYEILNYEFESKEVSLCLYNTLQMLHFNGDDPYLMGLVGKCLNKIYAAQLNHELGKIVDLPNPSFDEQYNTLLKMVQNFHLQEVAAIAYYYLEQHKDRGKQSEEYVAALIISKENFEKPDERRAWIDYYESHFSKRKYTF